MIKLIAVIFLLAAHANSRTLPRAPLASKAECSNIEEAEKFDCYPEAGANESGCEQRGCCWQIVKESDSNPSTRGVPFCYHPKNFGGYEFINITSSETGKVAFLRRTFQSAYPRDVQTLRIDVEYQTNERVRVKISDADNMRYEAPYPKISGKTAKAADDPQYEVDLNSDQLGFKISRKDGTVLFNSQNLGAFIYSDQFLQISSTFSGEIYGIGEHRTPLALNTEWTRFTLFTRDINPFENTNLYGSHPFYQVIESDGRSHGVFLHNSNAMDVTLQPIPAITFKTIGGVLDFYFFLGPTPKDVSSQYIDLIGKPFFPPYWGLGFQLCRWGYDTADNTRAVWQRTRDAQIPFDVQWNDIDYMVTQNDFTYDPDRFASLPELVEDIHKAGMHYVPILDPGVSASEPNGTYPPFEDGIAMDIFVKDKDGNVYIGKVWNPVSTAFPDFTNPKTVDYYTKQLGDFHKKVPFDAIWIDMNEPSNFYDGLPDGCPDDPLEDPPFVPNVLDGKLRAKTLCMTAKQYAGVHYNVHNLFGISHADVTKQSMEKVLGKRTFAIARSTFSGSGAYTGHWSGDNFARWDDLVASIPAILQFNIFGMPFSGADICGFLEDTNVNLCNRWMQLGAFYPFSRNHNVIGAKEQDPVALGDEVVDSSKKALTVRYTLLPYLYTLMYRAHAYGETVARPLSFEFPGDKNTHKIDTSFLWGSGIYIVPVLQDNVDTVNAYLPAGRWYDWYTGEEYKGNGEEITLDAPFDKIPVLIHGGNVLPTQAPAVTTTLSRQNAFTFIVALDADNSASGTLFWDDGESLDSVSGNKFGLLEFTASNNKFTSKVNQWETSDTPQLESIKLLGISGQVNQVTVNGESAEFTTESNNVVRVVNLKIPLSTDVEVQWS